MNVAAKKVLIVEDYEDFRRLLKTILEQLGHEVVCAADGYEAVEKARELHPDLILMDMALPWMDGVTATRRIKEIEELKEIPIIAITAHGTVYNQKAVEVGCDTVINKPVDLKDLSVVIDYLVQ